MSAEPGTESTSFIWLGNRNIIVPPGIVAVRRISPVPQKKRTPLRARPEGEPVCRAGNRQWFSDLLFADGKNLDVRTATGSSFSAHASCLVGLFALSVGQGTSTPPPPPIHSPLQMPAFVAVVSGGGGSTPRLEVPTPERPQPSPKMRSAPPPPEKSLRSAAVSEPVARNPVPDRDPGQCGAAADTDADSRTLTGAPDDESSRSAASVSEAAPGMGSGTGAGQGEGAANGHGAGDGSSDIVPSRGPYRVGNGIDPPRKIKDVSPIYPAGGLTTRASGTVLIEATVGVDGKVYDAKVVHSIPPLDQSALDAVRQWEFLPSELNGVAVAVLVTIQVRFSIH